MKEILDTIRVRESLFNIHFWASATIFVVAYIRIIFDVVDRVMISLSGAVLMISVGFISQGKAISE